MRGLNHAMVTALQIFCLLAASVTFGLDEPTTYRLDVTVDGPVDNHKQSINAGWVPNVEANEGESSPVRLDEETSFQKSLRKLYNGTLTGSIWTTTRGKVYRQEEVDFTPELIKKAGFEDKNYLVMISASWCGPCKRSYPLMKKLRKEGYIIYIFDTTKSDFRDYAALYKVRAYPTFIVYDNKKEVKRSVGMTSEKWFKENLKTLKEQNEKPSPTPDKDPYDGI